MSWLDDKDQPIWVVYRLKKFGLLHDIEPIVLQTTTKDVWETMLRKSLVQLIKTKEVELVAEGLTYETANKMIGLTKG
jgi:hypothetical protein